MSASHRNSPTASRVALAALLATIVVATAACGSDDNDATGAADGSTGPTITAAGATSAPTTIHGHDDTVSPTAAGVLEVEATDYAFENLPDRVPAGTRLALTNTASAELHELVAVRLADDETRSVEELMRLPEADLGAIIGARPPAAVLLAAPGGDQIAAVGDGTLAESGRYLVFCSIPSGVAPEVYLEAAASSNGQQPQVDGGPPHFVHGMFAELIVE